MPVDINRLKSVPYFAGLSDEDIASLGEFMFDKASQNGDLILLEDEPADTLYFVIQGMIKVFKTSPEGKEQILYYVRPGESFNDAPVLGGMPNLASAQSIGNVLLYYMKDVHLRIAVERYPQIGINATRVLAKQIYKLVSLVEDLSFKNVVARVAKILLESSSDQTGLTPRFTQQEMANMAGTAREMVGRSLKTLEEEGAIKVDRHRIIVSNKELLKGIAGIVC